MAPFDAQDSDLRQMIGRFRILIIGRRNAGKTTILHKVCNTTDDPEIYGTKGDKIDVNDVKATITRGTHKIEQAMVFKSSPGFIFHDSCGFEDGSEAEFEETKKFISEGVHARKLEERIHAIWYCIPMNEWNRTFQKSEEKFFLECDTGDVPVIVVFTKFAKLRSAAKRKIKEQLEGLSEEERSRRITERVKKLFKETGVLDKLSDSKNRTRPKSYVSLEDMTDPNSNCDPLLESTVYTLDDKELRLCLVSTQQSNLELCIKCAVATLVDHANRPLGPLLSDSGNYQYGIARWFSHLKLNRIITKYRDGGYSGSYSSSYGMVNTTRRIPYSYGMVESHEVSDFNNNLFNSAKIEKDMIIRVLQPLAAKGLLFAPANRLIQTGIATIIVLEYSAFLPNSSKNLVQHVQSAVDYYLKSPTAVVVEEGAKEISCQGYEKEELEKKILEFIIEHRMSKDLTAR